MNEEETTIELELGDFIKITDENIILRDFENPKYLNSNGSFNINTEDISRS